VLKVLKEKAVIFGLLFKQGSKQEFLKQPLKSSKKRK
jgi:hypothetical protein